MKLSFMTFACPQWSLDQVIDAAARHGYHGIEFRIDAEHAHGVEPASSAAARRETRQKLRHRGVEACCLATSLQFVTTKALDEAPARIDLAHDLGCPALRVFCGPLPESMNGSVDAAIETVGRNLAAVADRAQQAGVQLWLETHDTFVRAADAAAAVRLADHPAVGLNYDNMHPFRHGESVAQSFAAMDGLIRHTHFHDSVADPAKVVIMPLGEGALPMDEMFTSLMRTGYAGYLSGEWFGDQYGPDSDTALAAYKRDMTSLAERHGVRLG